MSGPRTELPPPTGGRHALGVIRREFHGRHGAGDFREVSRAAAMGDRFASKALA